MNETQKRLRCLFVLPNEIIDLLDRLPENSEASCSRVDEMDSGWMDEIRTALSVTLPICQPDNDGRGERNGHPLELMKIDTKEVSLE